MNKKIPEIFGLILVLPLAFWIITEITTLPLLYQVYATAAGLALLLMLIVGRGLPFDVKFIISLCLGYALAGKGFAYISIREPFYIGEIAFVICGLAFMVRLLSKTPVVLEAPQFAIMVWLFLNCGFLIAGFEEFRMLAMRDSSMGYYSLFCIMILYAMINDQSRQAMEKSLKWMVLFGMLSALTVLVNPIIAAIMQIPVLSWFFFPHADSFIPWLVAGCSTGFLIGVQRRSLLLVLVGIAGAALLITTKTAGIFSVAVTWFVLLLFARRKEVILLGFMFGTIVVIFMATVSLGGSKTLNDYVKRSEHMQTILDLKDRDGRGAKSTADWRIVWWTIVAKDTMRDNPVFGAGLGGDITTKFIRSTYNRPANASDARYPHNFFFTVLGRMGVFGVAVAGCVWAVLIWFLYQFARAHLRSQTMHPPALIAFTYVTGGMANSLVQATYESPYAAISHWCVMGYLMAYHRVTAPEAETVPGIPGAPYVPLAARPARGVRHAV